MTTPPLRREQPYQRPTAPRRIALATAVGVLLVVVAAVGTVVLVGSGARDPADRTDGVATGDTDAEREPPGPGTPESEPESEPESAEAPWSPPDVAARLEDLDVPDAPAIGPGELRDLLADMTSGDGARLGARLAWEVDAEELDSAARAVRPPGGTRLELLAPPVPTSDGTRLLLVGLSGRGRAGRGTTVWEVGPGEDGTWRIVSIAP